MSGSGRLAAVVPVFDHAATVGAVVVGCAAYVQIVVVVDDGSSDGSAAVAEGAIAAAKGDTRFVLCRHATNLGKGAALLTGFHAARELGATAVVVLDADGQHRPSDLPAFVQEHALHPAAILLGVRDLSGEQVPGGSRFGRAFSDFWVRRTAGVDLHDSQCGYRLLPLAATLALPVVARRYDYEVEVLVHAVWAGIPVRSVPIDVWYPRRAERVSHFRSFRDNARISWTFTRLVVRRLVPWCLTRESMEKPAVRETGPRRAWAWLRRALTQGARPVDLGAAAGLGALLGASPLRAFGVALGAYVALRTQLNPIAASLSGCVVLTGIAPLVLGVELELGHWFLRRSLLLAEGVPTPELAWETPLPYVLGSLPVALGIAAFAGWLTYLLARWAARKRTV